MQKASIKTNYMFNLLYQMLVVLSPIIVTPYLSRVLQADSIGMYQYVYAIANYFTMVVVLGTSMYGQREIATYQNDKNKVGAIFLHIQLLRLIMLLIATIGYAIVAWNMRNGKYFSLLLIEYLFVVGAFFDIAWFFQGLEQFRLISIRSCFIKILTIILIFTIVKSKADLNVYAIIMSSGVLLGNLILWRYVPKYMKCTKISAGFFSVVLKNACSFFVSSIATTIYVHLDKILLGAFASDFDTGYYSQGEKVVKMLITFITSLSMVLLPRVTSLLNDGKTDRAKEIVKYVWKYVLMVSIPMTVGLMCVSEAFVPLFFGEGYTPVTGIMIILAPLAIIIGSNSVLGYAILIPTKQQKEYNIAAIIGCVINLIINIILIPKLGAIGACIGTVLAEFSVCCTEYYFSRKIMGKILPIRNIIHYMLASAAMAATLLFMNVTQEFHGAMLFIEVVCGGITYFIVLLIMKDEVLLKVISMITKKCKKA